MAHQSDQNEFERLYRVAFKLNESLPLDYQKEIFKEGLRELSIRKKQSRKILLIGGAGYIGSVVTAYFLGKGYDVRCLDAFLYGNQATVLPHLNQKNYEFMFGDFRDSAILNQALEGITDVIILGGLVGDPITKKYPELSGQINDVGILHLIDQLNNRGLNKVIFISTCSNYGLIEGDVLADENWELKPLSLYAKAKVEAEKYIMSLTNKVDYCPTILRFATAFGLSPRMRFDLTVNEFIRELYLGKELVVYDHETWRPYCHVIDFSRALRRVLEAPKERVYFEVFNAGGAINNYTKEKIVEAIKPFIPNAKISYKQHGSDPRSYRVNFNKIEQVLYFKPTYSVPDGIKETLGALQNRLFDLVDDTPNFYGNYEIKHFD